MVGRTVSDNKLRVVPPPDAPGPPSPGNGGYGERLASIEAHMQHLATKADVEKALSGQLRGQISVLVAAVLAAGIAGATLVLQLIGIATS